MNNIINRKQIADGIHFSFISDSRYKVNRISVNFFSQLSPDAGVNALIPRLLSSSNRSYPERKALNEKKASLYSAKVDFNIGNIGDTQQLELFAVSIDNKYALSDDEDVTGEVVALLSECIFHPVLKDGLFRAEQLEEEKKALIETIEAEFNDKRDYARKRMYETFYEGEPAALNCLGTVEAVKSATAKAVTDAYYGLIESAPIEIFAIGCNDFKEISKRLKKVFGALKRSDIKQVQSLPGVIKDIPTEKIECFPVEQNKMVLGYKTKSSNYCACLVMAMILGGTPSSKLFTVVREKMSLCYYCWAAYGRDKCSMVIDCGVDGENTQKAKEAISAQLTAIAQGEFSEEDIMNAKMSIANTYKSYNDSPASIAGWYLAGIYRNDIKTPENALCDFEKVTKEEIMKQAELMTADTVYIIERHV
ncbi:MAG: insulinase family protein [Oscillospiraceae bacterium]|nr:insulinase family protein [Oscillospiraceae bacterium]